MRFQSFSPIGSQRTIEKRLACMLAMGFCSIMKAPRRGETFVTRKITRGMVDIALGVQDCLLLGNLDAKRDWGHAKDYVEMQWLMLQEDVPGDFVISTGKQHSVREFLKWSAEILGFSIVFEGKGTEELVL